MKSEKDLPMYLTQADLRLYVVNWSDDKIRRKIKDEGFPAVQEKSGRYMFPTKEVLDWIKRRTVRAG